MRPFVAELERTRARRAAPEPAHTEPTVADRASEAGRIIDAGGRELERERREIRLENLGRSCARRVVLLVLGPEAITDARRDATRAAAPLIRRRLRHAHGLEARHAGARRESWDARQPAVDHHAHALDRQARLGDRRREHDLAFARARSEGSRRPVRSDESVPCSGRTCVRGGRSPSTRRS